LQEAKDLKRECEALGAEVVLNHNDQTCNRGCSVTVEVHTTEKDLPVIQKVYSEKYAKLLAGHDVDFEAMNAVFDPAQENATCPACGHSFSTTDSECPDCGLVLG
ncbi:MAG: hypothetical protein HON90_17850, partial [Halobacteriovoraceae bacterium]|nr:hypothetical protein [Halobacteriovoraceae bacterium]